MPGQRIIDRFEAQAIECRNDLSLAALLGDAAHEMGFPFFALLHHASLVFPDRGFVRMHNYPEDWEHELVAKELIGVDPVHHACARTNIGFAWEQLPAITPFGSREREMLVRARRFGIGDGFTVPINVPGEPAGSCTFASQSGQELPRTQLLGAEQLGIHAFSIARRLHGFPMTTRCTVLSRRERECVRLIGAGKTDREIARILGISPETVHQYVKRARAAYGVASRAQLVACALRDVHVSFEDAIPPSGGME